jgi:ferredoxin
MQPYKIWHDRPECISCGACVAVTENWFLDEVDQLASFEKGIIIDEQELALNVEAAEVCPVNIIHLAQGDEVPAYFEEKGIFERPSGKRED